jgi:superfamily II DNA or RNA helicase
MSSHDLLSRLRERGLKAWQAEFAQSFVKDGATPFQVLVSPPGTGKSRTTAALVAELFRGETRRVLVLAPSEVCSVWGLTFRMVEPELTVRVVARKSYRELEAASPVGGSPWAQVGVYVLSQDFAKLDQIATSLCTADWDLVIVDEAHQSVSPLRAALFGRLINGGRTKRLLMLLSVRTTSFDTWLTGLVDSSSPYPISVSQWAGRLKDWDGAVVERPPVSLEVVPYTRGQDEIDFLAQLQTLLPAIGRVKGNDHFTEQILLRRFSSSLFALEQSLLSLRHSLNSEDAPDRQAIVGPDLSPSEPELLLEDSEPSPGKQSSQWADKPAAETLIEEALTSLESVTKDEKLTAIIRLMRTILDTSTDRGTQICIFSCYADTVSYLHSAFEDTGIPAMRFTGSSSPSDRHEVLERLMQHGGVLIATDAVMEGFALTRVEHVIYYDLPQSRAVLEQRRGRFDRFGRTLPCTLYLLLDESGALVQEAEWTEIVKESLRPADDQPMTSKTL